MNRNWLALALGAAVWAGPAQAQMVRAQDPIGVVKAMRAAGYEAALGTDGTGDPMISSSTDGSTWQLFFYNCTDHAACATVQFHSGYDYNDPVDLALINDWNRSQRFGRAFLDKDGDPVLEMDVDLDDGGLSAPLFIDNLEFWTSVLGKFEDHIGFEG